MSNKVDWPDRYDHLRKKYEYARNGQRSIPVRETHPTRGKIIVGWETTDRPETDQSPDDLDAELRHLLSEILEQEVAETATYENQIRCLLNAVECDIGTGRLADVVGCSRSYASRFEFDEEHGQAVEKEWSKDAQDKKVSPGRRKRILRRDNHQCRRCGETDDLQIHHIIPVSAGGENQDENLATLCEQCHKLAHGGSWTSPSVVYDTVNGFRSWIS